MSEREPNAQMYRRITMTAHDSDVVRKGGAWLVLAVALLAATGCAEATAARDDGTSNNRAVAEGAKNEEPAVEALTCDSDYRSFGIFDHFTNGGGEAFPEDAVADAAGGDDIVVDEPDGDTTTVWVLRPDGTAHTQLGLRQFEDGTWILETEDSCAGRVGPAHR
jgi:hypothetical protein